jgi:hypothetical protein
MPKTLLLIGLLGISLAQEPANVWLSGSQVPPWYMNQALRRSVSVRPLPTLEFPLYMGGQHSFAIDNSQISLLNVSAPNKPIAELLLSNNPERIQATRGLFHYGLKPGGGARLVYHHLNTSGGLLVFNLRLTNPSEKPAWIWLSDAAGGPGKDEVFVGHTATKRWLELHYQRAGQLLMLPPGGEFWIGKSQMYPNEIISGLLEMVLVEGEGAFLDVFARSAGDPEPPLESYQEGPIYRLEKLDGRSQHLHIAGRSTMLSLGDGRFETTDGQIIKGSWGSFYTYDLLLRNPDQQSREVALQLNAAGGIARGMVWLDGELIELPLIKPSQPYELLRLTLNPKEERRITLSTLPASGSNYPLRLLLFEPTDPEGR